MDMQQLEKHQLEKQLRINIVISLLILDYFIDMLVITIMITRLTKSNKSSMMNRAAQISTNNKLHDIINETIRKIVKNKGFVVVGCDITTNCLPNAKVKIILLADVETHVLSQSLIKQAYNVLYEIDTTKLTLSEVVDMILIQ
ncbi:3197_t:CDS:2, partial [Cetraspora pellucida]